MNHASSTSELEARMRPGAYSQGGFLGTNESLEDILAQDAQTLQSLGVSHKQIADTLESVLMTAIEKYKKDSRPNKTDRQLFFDLGDPETFPHHTSDGLPALDIGYLVGNLHVFFVMWRGLQACPWGCGFSNLAYIDFFILNRRTREYLTGAGLVIHLIREHHFFEGAESPYRTDPAQAVRVLEILPSTPLSSEKSC